MAKTLIFGLGGFGTRVTENVYRKLAAGDDTLVMAIDTDAYDLQSHAADVGMPYVMLGSDETVGSFIERCGNPDWIETSSPFINKINAASGSGQIRSVGRLLFEAALKSGSMMAVEERINKLINETLTDDGGFRVLIVTSIAGGLGSGVLLPFALWLRKLFSRRGISSVRMGAYLILPDVFFEHFSALRYDDAINGQMYSNAYATLQEMLTLDMIKTRSCTPAQKLEIEGLFDSILDRDDGKRVFDIVYCFDSVSMNGAVHDSYDAYIKAVSDAVCMYTSPSVTSFEDIISYRMMKEFPAFSACGVSKTVYPKDSVVKYCALRAAQILVKRWKYEKDKCGSLSYDIAEQIKKKSDSVSRYVSDALSIHGMLCSVPDICDALYDCATDIADKRKKLESTLSDYIEKLADELYRSELAFFDGILQNNDLPTICGSLMSVHDSLDRYSKNRSEGIMADLSDFIVMLDPADLKHRRFFQPERIFAAKFKERMLEHNDGVVSYYIEYGKALLLERVCAKLHKRITAMLDVIDTYYEQLEDSLHTIDASIEHTLGELSHDFGVKYILGRRDEMERLFVDALDMQTVEYTDGMGIWDAIVKNADNGDADFGRALMHIIERFASCFADLPCLDLDIAQAVRKSEELCNSAVTDADVGNRIGQIKQNLWTLAAPFFRVPDSRMADDGYAFYSISPQIGDTGRELIENVNTTYCTEVNGIQSKYELVCFRMYGIIRYEDCERFADGGEYHRYYRSCISKIKTKYADGDDSVLAMTPHISKDWHRILPSICLGEVPIVTETAADCDPSETDAKPIMRKIAPYPGDKPYIFVSYSHRDSEEVWDVIEILQREGYRVWYDEGIDPGTEWDEYISQKVIGCGFFLAFISTRYLASNNCKDELNYARDLDKNRLLVYLENVDLPSGMQMRLNRLQAVHKYKYTSREEFLEKLLKTDGFAVCRD